MKSEEEEKTGKEGERMKISFHYSSLEV